MKKLNSIWVFACGTALGVGLTLCVGAADKGPDTSHLQMVTYGSGVTGFFDSMSGKVYLYDADMKNCYQIRQILTPGEPMVRP